MQQLSVTVWFDATLGHYRARFRGVGGFDKKIRVPKREFEERGVDGSRESKQADTIAQEWAFAERRRLEGQKPTGGAMTLEPIFEIYRRRNPNGSMPITIVKNTELFNNLISYEPLRATPADQIDSGLALDYYDWRRKGSPVDRDGAILRSRKTPSVRSVVNELRFLLQLLAHANEWKRETGAETVGFVRMPKRVIEEEKQQTHRGRPLTPAEFDRLRRQRALHLSLSSRFQRIVIVGCTTGLRKDVLLGLRWTWIDHERKMIRIPAAYMKGKKSQKRDLIVPLSRWALHAIGTKTGGSNFVFSGRGGGRTWKMTQTFLSACDAAEISPSITMHDLRRTFASMLATHVPQHDGRGAIEERVIGALLGHMSRVNVAGEQLMERGGVTAAKYLPVSLAEMRSALGRLDAMLDEVVARGDARENSGKVTDTTAAA